MENEGVKKMCQDMEDILLENAKLKLQLLDQAKIIENLRTDRNNYRNLYEDLKEHDEKSFNDWIDSRNNSQYLRQNEAE
jgi:hypothetical protein